MTYCYWLPVPRALRTGSQHPGAAAPQELVVNTRRNRAEPAMQPAVLARALAGVERRGRRIRDDRLDVEVALLICHWFGVGPPAEDGLSAGRSPEVWGYSGRLRIVTIAPSPGVVKMP